MPDNPKGTEMPDSANQLNKAELQRYARHIVLRDVGGTGQQKLKAARVLIVGAGGLGAPVLQYLAAAGVGNLGIVDDDTVDLSNLQRQIIHDTDRVGMAKVESAKAAIARINPHINVEVWPIRLTQKNAYALIAQYDLVIDGSDSFETRAIVAAQCEELERPLVSGAVSQFDGSLTTFMPWKTDAKGQPNPNFGNLYPTAPDPANMATCEEVGVMGVLTGIIGTMQAQEAVNIILEIGEPLIGRLLLVDSRALRFETVTYSAPN